MEQKQKKKDETHTAATERRDDPVVRDGGRSGAGRPPYHAHLRAGYGKSTKPRVQGISAILPQRGGEWREARRRDDEYANGLGESAGSFL
jgi:hypothetical protein